jgi:serine/threonine-protein kinase
LLGGKYRLERLLGEGGMANVWLARNELLDLPVALKIVRPEIRGSETAARLLTEARVQANLRHPNIARVYDYGQTASGDAFIVMELLEGCSLAEWIEREGALSPVLAVQMMLPIIDALCAAHRAGVIHRDLKPDNIFISHPTSALCPKLLDFGIAKINDGSKNSRLTGRGGVVGSPAYMAPEQARGFEDCDERVDVWAACVVLYEAITGKPAFDGANHLALMIAVIEEELAPLTGPECDELWPILSAGLVKERDGRTSSMLTLGAQLAQWLAEQGAAQDLGGEPVHWKFAFSASDEGSGLAIRRPSHWNARVSSSASRSDAHGDTSRGRFGFDRRMSDRRARDRRSPTPLTTISGSRRTISLSPGAVRRAAAARLAVAACLGGGLLVLGLNHGPLAWLNPHPRAAFAAAGAEPYLAQPAPSDPLVQLPAENQVARNDATRALYEPHEKPAQAVFARTVREPREESQPRVAAPRPSAAPARAVNVGRVDASEPDGADSRAPVGPRAQLKVNAFPEARAVEPNPAKARPATTPRPANVLTVSPRAKGAQPPQPSEAELGLKNPW